MINGLLLLSVSVGNAVENNTFIEMYTPESTVTEAPTPVYQAPSTGAAIASTEDTFSQFSGYQDYDFWQVGQEEHPADAGSGTNTGDGDGEIVTAGEVVAPRQQAPSLVLPDNPPKPEPRPARPQDKAPAKPAPAPARPSVVNDIPNCRYGRDCWKGKGLAQRIQKIVSNVEQINSLHGAKLDPRYLLCTGYRESTFNPGAVGAQGEKGMFQVMRGTGIGALGYGPKVLPKSNYMTNMVHSTLAQTELSFLTLKMKVAEGASARTLRGNGSLEDYRDLARRYNGTGPAAQRYARAVTNCLSCMRSSFPSISGTSAVNESKARSCLNKAKH